MNIAKIVIFYCFYKISVPSDGFVCEHVNMTFCCIRLGRALASAVKGIWPVPHTLITWVPCSRCDIYSPSCKVKYRQ